MEEEKKVLVRASDIIKAYKDGEIDFAECVTLLMFRCQRSYDTAVLNIKLSQVYGGEGYGVFSKNKSKAVRDADNHLIKVNRDRTGYMQRDREYNPLGGAV